jgi:hypothetical protein
MTARRRPPLHLVPPAPLRIVIGSAEYRHLLAGYSVGFHVEGIDVRVELGTLELVDPPEAREFLPAPRRRRR